MHIPEERMVNMSQVVAVCLPFTHTHIMYTLQVEKTWFVSNFLICFRSLHLALGDRNIHK